jgi:uncharacterized phosphosugar-binding protein
MSAAQYRDRIGTLLGKLWETQLGSIEKASSWMAESIARGGLVHLFGSGHSVIPVLDIFPRYGSYPGFRPVMDGRLMWFNVTGSGGAPALLWLEQREGYAEVMLRDEPLKDGDVMVAFSHGGLNAAGIEVLLESKKRGLRTVAVTSLDNYKKREAIHSSGKKLADVADLVIDNCVPARDSLVDVDGWKAPVAASSTVAFVSIAQALVAEVASQLAKRGHEPPVFVSPNVGLPPDNNKKVFDAYSASLRR